MMANVVLDWWVAGNANLTLMFLLLSMFSLKENIATEIKSD